MPKISGRIVQLDYMVSLRASLAPSTSPQRRDAAHPPSTSSVRSPTRLRHLGWAPHLQALVGAPRHASVGSKFPVLTQSAAREEASVDTAGYLLSFSEEVSIDAGKVTIRPATEGDAGGVGVVLTRAFAGTPEGQNLSDVSGYISQLVGQFPAAVLLVARLAPNDPALLPPNQQSRVVGTVSLSLSPATRDRFNTLQPEDTCCYLSNMAVDGKLRRQGVASALLSAADRFVKENAKMGGIQLHVRLNDDGAKRLYSKWGYRVVGEDGFLVKVRGGSQRALMAKEL